MINNLHPDLSSFNCRGGLFDVSPCELHANIQRKVRYLDQDNESVLYRNGLIIIGTTWTIIGVQKNYQGAIVYRVTCDDINDTFGRCADPSEIEFVD